MIKCIIIEDQPPAQRILQKFIGQTMELELIGTFSNPLVAREFLAEHKVSLIFLDIHLPKISGIEFLKSTANHPHIILTTAFSDYAIESYKYNVVDYLLKPFTFERFSQAIQKAKGVVLTYETLQVDNFFIKSGYDMIKITKQEILYLKADIDYTEIITFSKVHLSTESLKYWLKKLKETFCQIHKSYIINTTYINKVSTHQVYLSNGDVLPIGRAYKKEFVEKHIK
ncbi:LytR/AlgR family response regulator transcription factor [Wenyingzhuangia sp. IMCC45467]